MSVVLKKEPKHLEICPQVNKVGLNQGGGHADDKKTRTPKNL
jgi:hypothetical protein